MPQDPLQKASEPYRRPACSASPTQARWEKGAWLFRDRTLCSLEILLDEVFRVPGTHFRFGIDGLIGLVPGLGDVLGGLLSFVIPLAAWSRGVPAVTLVRMSLNLGIGILVGTIPVVGDVFDVFWKANRRNYHLMQRHLREPRRHSWKDWMFLFVLLAGLCAVCAIPMVFFLWLMFQLFPHHH